MDKELPRGFEVTIKSDEDVPASLRGAKLKGVFDWDLMMLGVSVKKNGSGILSEEDVLWVSKKTRQVLKAGGMSWNLDLICVENYHTVNWLSLSSILNFIKNFRFRM